MTHLTEGQHRILQWIHDFTNEKGWSPSIREIAAGLGWNSPSTVHRHLCNLERNNFIVRGVGIRQIRITDKGRKNVV